MFQPPHINLEPFGSGLDHQRPYAHHQNSNNYHHISILLPLIKKDVKTAKEKEAMLKISHSLEEPRHYFRLLSISNSSHTTNTANPNGPKTKDTSKHITKHHPKLFFLEYLPWFLLLYLLIIIDLLFLEIPKVSY